MTEKNLLVREMEAQDISLIADYWFTAHPDYLESMGVDISKMPARGQFTAMLMAQLALPYDRKQAYALIWEADGEPIGHSNLNPLVFGEAAFMHLHIWNKENRSKGYGIDFIKMSLPYYFKNLELKKLCCEPYAMNPAPNRTLEKTGFKFVREYVTTPGSITFEQPVKLWEMYRPENI